jgi:outer membrane biogenesis lipoprotein LolB
MNLPDAPIIEVVRARPFCILHFAFCITLITVACAPRRISLPTDPGAPFPDYAAVLTEVTSACRGVRTLTAELGLRGRIGDQRLSGRVIAGFERPASMRLEGVAPIGQPAFILAARDATAVLLLPRDSRVIRGQKAEEILGALIGVSLAPADLQAILTGCVVPSPAPESGRLNANNWATIEISGGGRMYLRRTSRWELRAAQRDGWQIEYAMGQGRFPQSVRLVSDTQSIRVDLTASLSQIEANVDLDPAAFTVDVPASASPMSLDELRDSGPLRGQ